LLCSGCITELAAISVRELSDMDAAELIWDCLDHETAQPTLYLVQSLVHSHRHHFPHQHQQQRRRRLDSTDDDTLVADTATWRLVTEAS